MREIILMIIACVAISCLLFWSIQQVVDDKLETGGIKILLVIFTFIGCYVVMLYGFIRLFF